MLEKLKQLLGIEDSNDQDELLSSLLVRAQLFCEEYLKRPLLQVSNIEQYFLGYRSQTLCVDVTPISSVSSVVDAYGNVLPSDSYHLVKSLGMIRRLNGSFCGDLLVTYTGGYTVLPSWAEEAIIYTASALYNEQGSGTPTDGQVKSEEIPGVAKITYNNDTGITGDNDYGPIPAIAISFLNSHRVETVQ
jgi:hypothetical protein